MDRDQKHRCKFCRKTFPSGRSLGGHMRCHVSSPTAASASADVEKLQASRGGVQGALGAAGVYGLRENPKKTWRLSDSTAASFGDLREKRCRECGREFQSWKALFGHMRCHSGKIGSHIEEDEGEQGSWSGGGSHIDGGSIAAASVTVPKKKRRSRRRAGSVPVPASSSSISDYSKEQEDVAGILMMLSRDAGYGGNGFGFGFGFGFSQVAESSDKNSAVLMDGGLRSKKSELDDEELEENSDEPFKNKEEDKTGSNVIDSVLAKHECTTCNKSFHTYQALGGHRASHKRMRGCSENAAASIDQQAVGNHQCHICGKVFSSGQALGGHKRSHLAIASPCSIVTRQQEEVEEEEEEDLIDLNLPAPVDEDSSKGSVSVAAGGGDEYRSCWAGSNLQHEAMIGMTAN